MWGLERITEAKEKGQAGRQISNHGNIRALCPDYTGFIVFSNNSFLFAMNYKFPLRFLYNSSWGQVISRLWQSGRNDRGSCQEKMEGKLCPFAFSLAVMQWGLELWVFLERARRREWNVFSRCSSLDDPTAWARLVLVSWSPSLGYMSGARSVLGSSIAPDPPQWDVLEDGYQSSLLGDGAFYFSVESSIPMLVCKQPLLDKKRLQPGKTTSFPPASSQNCMLPLPLSSHV